MWRKKLHHRLPFDLMVDDRTMFTKCGGFVWVAHALGPDLQATSPAVVDAYYDKLAALEGSLGDGWTIFHDEWRWWNDANLPAVDPGRWPYAAQLIDAAERRQFTADKTLDRSLFIAVHYEPDGMRRGLFDWLTGNDKAFSRFANRHRFVEDAEKFFGSLALLMPYVKLLEGDALWHYFSQCVKYEPWPAAMPAISLDLSKRFGNTWETGRTLRIGRNHVRTVEVHSIGHLTADTIRLTDKWHFEHRWCVRIDPTAKHNQAKWARKMAAEYRDRRQSWGRRLVQHFTRKDEGDSNPEATYQVAEAEQLRVDVQLGDASFGPCTMNVHVFGEDEETVHQHAIDVELDLKDAGFAAEIATVSAVEAPLADIPGNDPQPREVPAKYAQIVRISPVTGINRGAEIDGKWDGPALTLGMSDGGVPIRVAWHGRGMQLGNTGIVGQSRAGKSALLAKLLAASLKYEASTVLVFDVGQAFLPTCLCLGGSARMLGHGTPCVQPLRHIDKPAQSLAAFEWLWLALQFFGVPRNHETERALSTSMALVARLPIEQRTMTALVQRLGGSIDVHDALARLTRDGGPWGETFDSVVDYSGDERVIGIECGALRHSEMLPLIVLAIFDSVRFERLHGQPCVIAFDEFHELLRMPTFRQETDRLAREIAKHNGVMVLATQSPADLDEKVAAVIKAQCPNMIYVPDPDVLEPNQARFYRALGCTDDELRMIASGYQAAQYYIRTPQLRCMATIRLTAEAEDIICHTTPRDIQQCHQLVAEGVATGEDFTKAFRAWLAATRAEQAA